MQKIFMFSLLVLGLPVSAQAVTIEQRYAQSCAPCHASGVMNAPKTHDRAAWAPRLKQGDDALLAHIKNGYKMMPAKGLCNDCTDAEYKALVKFMSN